MSPSTAVRGARPATRPVPRPTGRSVGPRLRIVSAPAGARSRAGLVVGCLTLLAVGLLGLLLLNVSLEKGAFVRRQQQTGLEQLIEQRDALAEELAALEAPQSLAGRAAALGMVEAPNAAFLRTSDGRVLGVPSQGVAESARPVKIPPAPAADPGSGGGQAESQSLAKGRTEGDDRGEGEGTDEGHRDRHGRGDDHGGAGTSAGQGSGATVAGGVGEVTTKAGTPSGAPARKAAGTPATAAAGTP